MGTQMHLPDLVKVVGDALAQNAERVTRMSTVWDIAGRCESPVEVNLFARPEAREGRDCVIGPGRAHSVELRLQARCRRCAPCLRSRAALWASRATAEILQAPRTWFGTLTLTPAEQFMALSRARDDARQQGIDFETLSQEEQFLRKCRTVSREITLWFKRVRKNSGAKLRYLIVAERHKSGEPHWHLLLHECWNSKPVRYSLLKEQWGLGHAMFKLVNDQGPAWYVSKYLTKSNEARVRASLRYGEFTGLPIVSQEELTPET